MITETTIKGIRHCISGYRNDNPNAKIGFIPTMGYLHEGHLSLMRAARKTNDFVVVSIFVNPIQFGPAEDFETYPRDERRDLDLCRAENVDLVFIPPGSEIFPESQLTSVNVKEISDPLCGRFRPGHFNGVTTIVCKLFNIIKPDRAYFGQKDGQQSLVIKRMVKDLNFDIEISVQPTIRETSGLAMSSRNVHLSDTARERAAGIYSALQKGKSMHKSGVEDIDAIMKSIENELKAIPNLTIQYLDARYTDSMKKARDLERPVIIALAVYLESVRLIDNIILEPGDRNGKA